MNTITYTEILSRALSSIESEIEDWRLKCESLPQEQRERMFVTATEELRGKWEALTTLYRIETGKN